MSSFLERMAATSAERARQAREVESEDRLWERARSAPPAPELALSAFDLIAEVKPKSPSEGALAGVGQDLGSQVSDYCDGGAAAVSVLTEPTEFGGSLAHLEAAARVASAAGRPVMRKDFLVDPYQVIEARAAGSGGVLLIVRMLTDSRLAEMLHAAAELGMFTLLEAFDEDDLDRVGAVADSRADARVLVGVNCRDLRTLEVDRSRFSSLASRLPSGLPAVAESGIDGTDAIGSVVADGYRLALVGSALMRSGDPGRMASELIAAGRAAAGMPTCS